MSRNRIDTHHHVISPFYRQWLDVKGVDAGGLPIPDWDPVTDLALLDEHEIQTAILSVSTPGVEPADDPDEARSVARRLNEYSAELVRDHPGRYGFFATLTLPDVDGALEELSYALDDLGVDGVVLHANSKGIYLGDPAFDALFAELQRRAAVVFVHPSALPGPGVPGIPAYAADFLLDSVRAALNLARSGTLDRCPDVKFILSHAGGFLPFAGVRVAGLADAGGDRGKGFALMQRFYLDSALAGSGFALPSTLAWAPPDHLTFGTDFPYAPADVVAGFTMMLDSFDAVDHGAVDRGNAAALFPRLAEVTA